MNTTLSAVVRPNQKMKTRMLRSIGGQSGAKSDFFFFLKKFLQRRCSLQLADAITSEGFPPHYREEERREARYGEGRG